MDSCSSPYFVQRLKFIFIPKVAVLASANAMLKAPIEMNDSWYNVFFVVSGSIKKLFSIFHVNIYLFSIFV